MDAVDYPVEQRFFFSFCAVEVKSVGIYLDALSVKVRHENVIPRVQ